MLGIIGDLHFKNSLSYSKFIEDGREEEEQDTLDFIVKKLSDCDTIVLLGDVLNSKTNTPETIKKMVRFVEKFSDKKLFIISGNHGKKGDGTTALDFLKEIKNDNWTIITKEIVTVKNMTFLPYLTNAELETTDSVSATKQVMKTLKAQKAGNILFAHHTISDFMTDSGVQTSSFDEIVIPKASVEKEFDLIVAGHIHKYSKKGKTIVLGSTFNNEVNETQKYILKIDEKTLKTESIKLPGRKIYGLKDPSLEDLDKLDESSIVKVTITDKKIDKNEIKEALEKFDARILIQKYPREREQIEIEGGNLLELPTEELLELYAKKNKLDIKKITQSFKLIK